MTPEQEAIRGAKEILIELLKSADLDKVAISVDEHPARTHVAISFHISKEKDESGDN